MTNAYSALFDVVREVLSHLNHLNYFQIQEGHSRLYGKAKTMSDVIEDIGKKADEEERKRAQK